MPTSPHVDLNVDVAVIGAGVVGLATARALARAGRDVLVLEATAAIGTGVTARNSEVIHAGLYYATGSLKARLCVAGRRALYDYCAARGVGHRRLGKLVVAASDAEVATLDAYLAQGRANGVDDLRLLDGGEARALEPALTCAGALLSPSTGIVDVHGLVRALDADARAAGADVALAAPVVGGAVEGDGLTLRVGGSAPATLRCRAVVDAAGLDAQAVARSIVGLDARTIPPRHLAKGHYFTLRGSSPFARLVYPVADAGGLGVHLTLDLAGQPRFGPDVAWVDAVDYAFDEARAPAFYAAVRRYWPALPDGALQPGYTGIRPKIVGPGAPAADFMIQGHESHDVPGLVCLYGIESPGLTASLAIADEVAQRLAR
ncbi:MAG TPA: NAD(P)/FAD-dependent oxidoreductase [Polyangia bacterium]|nr:NAD(P)/FAD-dependent oxidoreductase [Polyangia bacterium]